jgi:hypothetical protein
MSPWHEVTVRGPERLARAFVAGWLAGRRAGGDAVVLFHGDLDLEGPSVGERLRELLSLGGTCILLVPDALFDALVEGIAQRGGPLDLHVEHSRAVSSASFHLEGEVFSRDGAGELRAVLAALPDGVHLVTMSEGEEVHPEARGVELYAPMHDYVYRVAADVSGELSGVIILWQRATALDLVEVGPLRLAER